LLADLIENGIGKVTEAMRDTRKSNYALMKLGNYQYGNKSSPEGKYDLFDVFRCFQRFKADNESL